MNADSFGRWFELLWSILAIGLGVFSVFFIEKAIKSNVDRLKKWHQKTGFSFFKVQAENYDSTYMRLVTTLVGIILIVVGILTLFKNI